MGGEQQILVSLSYNLEEIERRLKLLKEHIVFQTGL